jgi:hypothetical protein
VLLEIAWCKPIYEILGAHIPVQKQGVTGDQIQKVREILLSNSKTNNFERDLEYRIGERYKNATYACIKGDFGSKDGDQEKAQDTQQLQKEFFRQVVQELETCII